MALRGMLKSSYSVISESRKSRNISRWLTDNFYLIDKHYRLALANREALKYSSMYELLKRYCESHDYIPDKSSLVNYLSARRNALSYRELASMKTLLAICAINKIGEALKDSSGMAMLPNSVKLLMSLSNPDFDEILPLVWQCEPILAGFEEGYNSFDSETKMQYRVGIADYARKNSLGELDALRTLINEAKSNGCPLGTLLFGPKKEFAVAWMLLSAFIFALLVAIGFAAVGWVTLFLLVPFGMAASSIADQLISFKAPAYRAPRMMSGKVPDRAKTLVTVAALMNGGKGDDKLFESLSRFRYMNPDENIYFCLLADLPDSKTQFRLEDSSIIENTRRKIDELNRLHGDRFCLFFRERVKNESEERFGGWERKRGAVCELISHIVQGGKTEYYGGDFIREIKYILTLDSDTNLSVGSVKELLSIALHPVNRPVVENGRVVSGYGIIQPSVRTELASAYFSGFSRLISGAGGADVYANASFQRSQSLFGSGNFCGKGLIDVSLFASLVGDKLPEGLILSHDVIEGSILRTLCASDIVLTDSTPGNTVSFFRRLHRWIRGDFQNLWFLKTDLLSSFSKLRLVATVLRHSSAVFSLLAVVVGCFLKDTSGLPLFILAYSEFFLPSAFAVLRFLLSGSPFACIRFFSKARSMLAQTFKRLFFELSSGCRKAVLTLHAFILSSVRLVTRKKTLEWTTAAQTEKLSSSLGKYVLDSVFSACIGLLILIFANPPFMRFVGLLYFVYPLVSTVLSRPLGGETTARPNLTEKQKKLLSAHASDMVRFYLDNVGEATNYLPPDNIQLSPVASIAMRTSPTNIGFYLVSLLAARDLGVIDSKHLFECLDESISVIERLEKYKGNLYNWYDISNLSVIGERYISSVDCGNFIVMLVALKEGLKEYLSEEEHLENIVSRCEKLIENADFAPLYDSRRELFKIGIRENEETADGSCYDLLMSEARMTGYFAVATSIVPKKHWQSLGRTLTHRSGYIGMKSWSGTAFEYLMPQLFLPLYRDSFLFESIAFSLMIQRAENPIWGVSESGFYSFDSEMNYQYKANGIQALALRRIAPDEKIVSPYSTYLSLCICGNSALKNLKAFENLGMYGKYGLYEALDLNNDSGGICVKSYMAHHVGMSIIACMNAVSDNLFVRRFMSDVRMFAANELLQEKIPVDAHVFEDELGAFDEPERNAPALRERTEQSNLSSPSVALISRGDMAAVISSSGHIGLTCGERMLANTEFDKSNLRFSPGVVFSRGSRHFGCAPLYGGESVFGFERGNGVVSHIASGREFSGTVHYSFAKNCNCFIVNTRAESLKKYDITFVFEPVLETKKKYLSHISFSRLFIESEYDRQKRILYFHRRSGLDGRHVFTIAVAPREKDMSFSFLTSRESFRASSVLSPLDYAGVETDNGTLECIDPLCLVRASGAEGGRAAFLLTCGETKQECERNIRLARADKRDYSAPAQEEMLDRMLPALLYNININRVDDFSNCQIGDLWSRSISGDHPLCVASLNNIAMNRTNALLRAFLSLARVCIRTELIFLVNDNDKYNRPVEGSVRECCVVSGASQYIGRNGGIFILRSPELGSDFVEVLKRSARFYIDFTNDTALSEDKETDTREIVASPLNASPLPIPENGVASHNGYFIPDGFVVDKSRLPLAPYSYILTGYRFSSVVTQSSLGYTFFDNARERRLCSFYGDPRSLDNGERVFAISNGKKYDLCAVSNKVRFEKGSAVYCGEIEGTSFAVTVTVPPKFPVKLIRVQYSKGVSFETRFELRPVMGDSVSPVSGIETKRFSNIRNEGFVFRNPFGMTFPEGRGFAGVCGGSADADSCVLSANSEEAVFFLGACMTESGALKVAKHIDKPFFEKSLEEANRFARSLVPSINIRTKSKSTDAMMNYFLPYQVAACRFYARGSFYQSGGAYGFRDQLQDSLALIYSDPRAVRTHIIRCCAHQYSEGSVMHWWHTRHFGRVNRGIKSKCSDDMLYLPIVTADYLKKTGDSSLLEVETRYLVSPPLDNENERYEQPGLSESKESVYRHCLRALSYAERRGKNGLLLMGSCDWNDAFSLVGAKGRGESVFTTLLFIIAVESFLPIIERRGDNDTALHYRKTIEELRRAVEEKAFFGDRYARAFCDDGTILGIEGCDECEIDILSQAFAALAGLDRERVKIALNTAFSKLYDRDARIFKLFSPPFANGKAAVGYIRGYVSGIRENGGQYTHGVLWGALGCLNVGMDEEALLILDCANPASRSKDKELAKRYKNEPYAVSADIYSGNRAGRGGWSWYTGAASWFYRIMLENVLGIKLGADQTLLDASPIIAFEAEIRHGDAVLCITASEQFSSPRLNGSAVTFPLKLPQGEYTLELPLK